MQKVIQLRNLILFFLFILLAASPKVAMASVDIQKIENYKQKLSDFPKGLTPLGQYILKAKDAYFEVFSIEDLQAIRDAGFKEFFTYYSGVIAAINEGQDNFLKDVSYDNLAETEKNAKQYGFNVGIFNPDSGEAQAYENVDYLLNTFEKYISPVWNTYLTLAYKIKNIYSDGGVTLSHEELYETMAQAEGIVQNFPEFVMNGYIKEKLAQCVEAFVFGADNTPIYDFNTKVLLPEVKNFFEQFVEERKNSAFYPYVNSAYEYLKSNKFKVTDEYYKELSTLTTKNLLILE